MNNDSPSFRKDPVTNRWVIISKERSKRPIPKLSSKDEFEEGAFCPFCAGNESETPPTIRSWRTIGSNNPWDVRVFANKHPALVIENEPKGEANGIYDTMAGVGAHEVIVESPNHVSSISDMSTEHLALVLKAWRERLTDLRRDSRFKTAIVFKNHRRAAGASLEHAHSQLIALPMLAKRQKEEIDGAKAYFDFRGRCVFCDIRDQELKQMERLVYENEGFVAFVPYAARFPFEIWVLPRTHNPWYETGGDDSMSLLADVIRVITHKLDLALDNPPYNLFVRSAPFAIPGSNLPGSDYSFYHWHIELIPTLTRVAGFEWATEFYINPTPPEEAASHLRSIDTTNI